MKVLCLFAVLVLGTVGAVHARSTRAFATRGELVAAVSGCGDRTCCYSTDQQLYACPHMGGVCCPHSSFCCPANFVCGGTLKQPSCERAANPLSSSSSFGSSSSSSGSGSVATVSSPFSSGSTSGCSASDASCPQHPEIKDWIKPKILPSKDDIAADSRYIIIRQGGSSGSGSGSGSGLPPPLPPVPSSNSLSNSGSSGSSGSSSSRNTAPPGFEEASALNSPSSAPGVVSDDNAAIAALANSLPVGVTVTTTKNVDGQITTTTITRHGAAGGAGSGSGSGGSPLSPLSESSESSALAGALSAGSSSIAPPPPSPPSLSSLSSGPSLSESAGAPPPVPSSSSSAAPPPVPSSGSESSSPSGDEGSAPTSCETESPCAHKGKLKINSNVEINIGKKQTQPQ